MVWELAMVIVIAFMLLVAIVEGNNEAQTAEKNQRRLNALELETIKAQAELEQITGRG